MPDRTAEIRALVDNYNALDVVAQMRRGSDYADAMATDIAWLLDEVQMLRADMDEAIRTGDGAADYWRQQFAALRREQGGTRDA